MKSEKGVTLTSLIVYVIGMVMVISIVSVLTTYFYKNINLINDNICMHLIIYNLFSVYL